MSDIQEQKNPIEYQLVQIEQSTNNDEYSQNIGESQKNTITEDETGEQIILIGSQQPKGILEKAKEKYRNIRQFIKKHWTKICGVFSVILTISVSILYYSLKQRCPYDADHLCLKQFIFPNLFKWISIVVFNSLATIIQFHMLISKSTHRAIPGFGFLQSVYFFIFNDNTINLHYYMGGINAIHIILFVVLLIFYLIIRLWMLCCKKSKWICLLGNLMFIASIAILFYNSKVVHGCDYWTKGINGELENNQGMCKVPIPSLCWYKMTHYWQDISLLLPTCDNASNPTDSQEQIDKYFSPFVNDSRYIAFSNLNNVPEFNRTDEVIQQTVFELSKGYSSIEQAKNDKYEVLFDRKDQKYHIEVQFNKTLSDERKKIAEEKEGKPLSKNILLIFIDAVSRQSMHLKMPKTVEWFEKRTIQNSYKPGHKQTEKEKQNSQSFEFYKYNSIKPYTYDNLSNLLYGKSMRDVKLTEENKLVGMSQKLKDQGYVTAHSSDQCQTLSLGFDPDSMEILKSSRYDHETQSYACDPNFQDPQSTFGLFQGPYSIIRRCLYGKRMADYPLEYAKSFFQKYQDSQKFMHLEFSYGHEGTGEVINYLDDPLSEFLEEMSDEGLLKDTTVILFNDHGLHMQGIFYLLNLENVFIEVNLPGLFINIPPELNEKYGDQMSSNQQTIVSIKNLHHFINHLTTGETYYNIEKSLFTPQQYQKHCYDVGIDRDNCSCK